MFELPTMTSVKLTNVNPRIEKHGVDSVPAVDLNFLLDAANSVLTCFDGGLLSALYHKLAEGDDEQPELDGVEPLSDLPNLRFPKMAPVRWDAQLAGYALVIDYGLGADSNLELEACNVGKFVLDCKEGGTVEVKFQVQCNTGLTERILGKLALMIGQEVQISLVAPKAKQEEVSSGREGLASVLPGDTSPDAPLTPEDVFIAAGTQAAAVH